MYYYFLNIYLLEIFRQIEAENKYDKQASFSLFLHKHVLIKKN